MIVLMGSGAEAVEKNVHNLNFQGRKIGMIKVRLALPFAIDAFLDTLSKTTKAITILDRTKEPGNLGEPLYHDVLTAFFENRQKPKFAMPSSLCS